MTAASRKAAKFSTFFFRLSLIPLGTFSLIPLGTFSAAAAARFDLDQTAHWHGLRPRPGPESPDMFDDLRNGVQSLRRRSEFGCDSATLERRASAAPVFHREDLTQVNFCLPHSEHSADYA